MASMMLSAQAAIPHDLSSLRAVLFVGAPLPENVREQTIARLCPQIYEFYGMQETGALVVSTPSDRKRRPESVGRVIPFAEVRIVDESGKDLEPNQLGEIIGRSPNAVTEYFQQRGEIGGDVPQWVGAHWRSRKPGRGRLSYDPRPQERHDYNGRSERACC
jgi:fatty-acyl-CoA synthase